MKKIKVLFMVLLVAAVVMGAGYAAWTDHTTVEGTIGTGTMNVEIDTGKSLEPTLTGPAYVVLPKPEVSEDKNSVSFEVANLYPTVYKGGDISTHVKLHMQIENVGSVPVKLDRVELIPNDANDPVWEKLKAAVFMHWSNNPKGYTKDGGNGWNSLTGQNAVTGLLKDLGTFVATNDLKNFVMRPGDVIRFGGFEDDEMNSFRFWLPAGDVNNDEYQGEDVGFTLVFHWKQFNM
ncbi:MAG: hypothetical protein WDA53_09030 [Bacillota bacterium]